MEKNRKNKTEKDKTKKQHPESIKTDVLGSYTGVPEDKYDTPVQDADDL